MPRRYWYQDAFGADYLRRYRHRDAEEARRAVAHLVLPLGLAVDAGVLDLCCGAGRHLVHLSAHFPRAVGFDLSHPLLTEAARVHGESGLRLRGVRGDMRVLPFADAAFALVTNFFTAFGYFDSDAENFGVFGEVARVLEDDGVFLFDFLNSARARARVHAAQGRWETHHEADGTRRRSTHRLSPDGCRAEKVIETTDLNGETATIIESVRLFTPEELRAGMMAAGLAPACEFGDYQAGPFDAVHSDRWIVWARRAARG